MRVIYSYFSALLLVTWLIPALTAQSYDIHYNSPGNQSVEVLLHRCDSLLRLGNLQKGSRISDSAKKAFLQIEKPGPLLQFRYYAQQGRYFSFAGESEIAFSFYLRATKQLPFIQRSFSTEIARLYGDIGSLQYRLKNYPEAMRNFQLALSSQLAISGENSPETMVYRSYLINACRNNFMYDKAIELSETCANFLDNNRDPLNNGLLDVYLAVAEYYISAFKQYARVENYLSIAFRILQKEYPTDHFKYGLLYHLKGRFNYSNRDSENALHFFNRSVQLAASYPSLKNYQVNNYYYIASVYCYQKQDYGQAIQYCKRVIRTVQSMGYPPADFFIMMGISHWYLKQPGLAAQYYRKAISLSSSLDKKEASRIASQAYFHLSRLFSNNNHPDTMLFYLEKALKSAREYSSWGKQVSKINLNLSWLYYHMGDYMKSLKAAQQSIIALCSSFSDTSVLKNPAITDFKPFYALIESFTMKANALEKADPDNLEFLKSALNCQELAVQLIEQGVTNIKEEESELTLVDNRKRAMNNAVCYASLLYLKTGKQIYAEKALSYAEKSKMQVLRINTEKKNKLIRAGVPDSLIQKEEQLNNCILDLENQLALIDRKRLGENNNNLVVNLTRLYDQRDVLNSRFIKDFPAYGRSRYDIPIAGLDKIQGMLSDDQVIVEYQLLLSELFTFVISRDTFSITHQLFDNRFYGHIRQLRDIISSNNSKTDADSVFKAFSTSSLYLYNYLMAPQYDQIKGKRLIIVPHNELTQIPFEVLITKAPVDLSHSDYRSLPYMIREFPIVYAYSANFLFDQEADQKHGSGTAIFLPDYSTYGSQKEPDAFRLLEGAAKEALAVRKISRGKLYKGKFADENWFRKKASRYRVLHIASHALVDEKLPSLSYLAMSASPDSTDDGFLYAYELIQMKLSAQLVVLSGCNTGFGKLRFSEGLISLARSFFYTGVRTVAFTLWPVADNAGSDLVSLFYRGLNHRQTLDVAMRNAKMKFLENADPVKTHPFYWANYIVVGRTDHLPLQRFPQWPVIALGSLVAIILAVIFYRKFKV